MAHTIDYTTIPDLEMREAKALEDLEFWFGGTRRFLSLTCKLRREPKPTLEQFKIWASFAGVQGYPVEIWYKEIWG